MADKVVGGTPKTAPSLCLSCSHGQHVRGHNFDEIVFCHSLERDIKFSVERCSGFNARSETDLYDMRQIAWNIESRKRGTTGFYAEVQEGMETVITPPKSNSPELSDE